MYTFTPLLVHGLLLSCAFPRQALILPMGLVGTRAAFPRQLQNKSHIYEFSVTQNFSVEWREAHKVVIL